MSEAVPKTESHEDFWARHSREHKEAVERGEYCSACGAFILWVLKPPGYRKECYDCKQKDKPDEFDHKKFIRCPKCRGTFDPYESEFFGLFEDGVHQATCPDPECEHEFEVTTSISYSFTSPELDSGEDEGGDEEDSDEE